MRQYGYGHTVREWGYGHIVRQWGYGHIVRQVRGHSKGVLRGLEVVGNLERSKGSKRCGEV